MKTKRQFIPPTVNPMEWMRIATLIDTEGSGLSGFRETYKPMYFAGGLPKKLIVQRENFKKELTALKSKDFSESLHNQRFVQ